MKFKNYNLYIFDILECCEKIGEYLSGIDRAEFAANRMLQDAVIPNIEIIGEAAKNLSEGIRAEIPDVAWSEIMRMRGKIVHHYFRINSSFSYQYRRSLAYRNR